ncbi:MAG: hypothetical protein WBP81_09975 [Solirubrobacteraceae bacterium]
MTIARLSSSPAVWLSAVLLAGCGAMSSPATTKGERSRSALEFYLRQIEPLRLGVNRLLNNADPILEAFRERKITPAQAATRMDQLERRFAAYTPRCFLRRREALRPFGTSLGARCSRG